MRIRPLALFSRFLLSSDSFLDLSVGKEGEVEAGPIITVGRKILLLPSHSMFGARIKTRASSMAFFFMIDSVQTFFLLRRRC